MYYLEVRIKILNELSYMIITLFLAVYRVAVFSVNVRVEPWSKPVTMKNFFLEMGRDWTLAFHVEPLGSIWNSMRTICRESAC